MCISFLHARLKLYSYFNYFTIDFAPEFFFCLSYLHGVHIDITLYCCLGFLSSFCMQK